MGSSTRKSSMFGGMFGGKAASTRGSSGAKFGGKAAKFGGGRGMA